MLPQLWLKRRVRVKWIAHSALPPLHHFCFFGPDEFLLKAACTGPSANPKQEQRQDECTTSRMCDLFHSDPAFYPRLRQHWSAAQWTCDGRGLERRNLKSLSGAGKPFDSAAKKDDKKNNHNNHNNNHHHNRIQLQHTRNVATI